MFTSDLLNHGAYWLSIQGEAETQNSRTQVVYVPLRNRLSPASLRGLCVTTAREYLERTGSMI
jgi:hypothetical protein